MTPNGDGLTDALVEEFDRLEASVVGREARARAKAACAAEGHGPIFEVQSVGVGSLGRICGRCGDLLPDESQ